MIKIREIINERILCYWIGLFIISYITLETTSSYFTINKLIKNFLYFISGYIFVILIVLLNIHEENNGKT